MEVNNNIIQGDCIEVLKTLPDNSVDAIITDPPYDLVSINKRFSKEDSAPAQFGKDGSFSRLSKGFMGKTWDGTGIAFKTDIWKEAFRVLKHGGHLLAFGGTRTFHRMACAIEDSGFEIRDCIEWIYGSGFPKSLNIGKQIDKLQGNEREIVGISENDRPNSQVKGGMAFDKSFNDGQGHETINITKGNSQFEGWGTALKPSHEPIVLARKPLSEKSVAENVLKWGTGGINIDGCRVANELTREQIARKYCGDNTGNQSSTNNFGVIKPKITSESVFIGRFPANLIHDGSDEVIDEFPMVEDELDDPNTKQQTLFGDLIEKQIINASRFFYCAKASKDERNKGCEELELKPRAEINKIMGECSNFKTGSGNDRTTKFLNSHPTVKPVALMEYLIKLITPPKGTVLDPFTGSGTTGVACARLGFNFIGIEQEPEYVKIAEARIKEHLKQQKLQ